MVGFPVATNIAFSIWVSINKKGTDLFIKVIFETEQSVSFTLRSKTYFEITKMYGFIGNVDQTRSSLL